MQIYLKSKYGFGLSIQGRRGIIHFDNSQQTGAIQMSTNLLIFYRTNMAKIDTMLIMAVQIVDISNGVYKIRKIFA